jgi:hypothetical protein
VLGSQDGHWYFLRDSSLNSVKLFFLVLSEQFAEMTGVFKSQGICHFFGTYSANPAKRFASSMILSRIKSFAEVPVSSERTSLR